MKTDTPDETVRELDAAGHQHPEVNGRLPLRDRAGADPAEWAEDLRVREFPEVKP